MNTNNWRPAQAEPAMDGGDWRTQLPPDSRQRIVNKIMDTLKRHLPVSGQEGLHELRTMAVRFEENIYTAATSQSDYLRKITLKMLVMETESQTAMPSNLPSNFASNSENPPDPASLDSTAQRGTTNVGDWQEEVYQKIKIMKEMYLPDLNEMHQKIAAKLQQHDSLPRQLKTEQLEKLKIFKAMLERMIAVLQLSKNSITPNFKEKLSGYEKQIVNFISTHRPRKPVPPLQHGQLPLSHMHSMEQPQQSQSQLTQAYLDSTAQRGTTNVGDWQEEVYQKIKIMKEMYLPDLNEMHQKIAAKLQQHDSLPRQLKTEQLEKLKIFKAMLERMIAVLQLSKNSITPNFKEKLSGYEKQIVNFISTHRPRKPVPPLQHGQLPLSHMHSMEQPQQSQSQLTQAYLDSTAQRGTTNVGDWQEEVYQKIKIMKEMYLPDLNEMHQKIAAKLQQHGSLPRQLNTEQLEKLKIFKAMLERMIAVLQFSKNSITLNFKEKLSGYEKQIVKFISTHRPRKRRVNFISTHRPRKRVPPL